MVKSAIVVGGGLVGPAIATLLKRAGFNVSVLERNGDPRLLPAPAGKSVNLTLCVRGFATLDMLGVGDTVRALSVPVYGRVIHNRSGTIENQPYGTRGECLYSIARHSLSQLLVDMADRAGVPIRFCHRCIGVDPERGEVRFEATGGSVGPLQTDLVIGADGARSVVRHQLLRRSQVQYSQRFSTHANKELRVPAAEVNKAGLDRCAIHIWPRGQLMLIAFPNLDGSLTCTLHMPFEGDPSFAAIRDAVTLERFFADYFPDVRPLMPTLVDEYFSQPEVPMVSVKLAPWTFGGLVALVGDAAHAVWPSYGQGANAGLEDCLVLAELLSGGDIASALAAYDSRQRPNGHAIADLSEEHFDEIRDRVGDPAFQTRKRLERRLSERFGERYIPLYCRVAFTRTPYAEAVDLETRQRVLVDRLLDVCGDDLDLDSPPALELLRAFV